MSALYQQNNESTATIENTFVYFDRVSGNKSEDRITSPALKNIRSLPRVRKKKILEVRQQLVEGTYDIEERLNIALDHLLDGLIG